MASNGALNVSVLGAAKEMYMRQLEISLIPLIHEGFISLWEDACRKEDEQGGYNYLRQFQIFLKDIPNWNQTILEEEARRIQSKVDILMDLVAAVFISHVQIMASVRLRGNNSNIRLRIPSAEVFIHTVYTNAAEMIYYNPQIFQNHQEREAYEQIRDLIEKSIDETIESMIPVESIMKEYISDAFNGHVRPKPQPEPEPEPGRLLTSDDIGLPSDIISGDSPDNDHFGTGDDPFSSANPFTAGDNNDVDPFGGSSNDVGEVSQNLFGSSSNDDPFGSSANDDPFSGSSGGDSKDIDLGVTKKKDTEELAFKDDDTVKLSEMDDPFSSGDKGADDPFASDEKKEDDPFGGSSSNNDDPFGGSSSNNDDPFGGSSSNDDPFASGGGDDPFASGGGGDDPFASSSNDDPFATSGGDDPFASGGGDDPFASGGGGDDPFASGGDPFASPTPAELTDDLFGEKTDVKVIDDDLK